MSRTSTEPRRVSLNGPTMGSRWTALWFDDGAGDPLAIGRDLVAAVTAVDAAMSTWKPDSDLMRLNAAPVGEWMAVPERLMEVLRLSLAIGCASGGAFDIGVGDAVNAWGFGPAAADRNLVQKALAAPRRPAHAALELDPECRRVRKDISVTLDLNGIAKGYGVDRLAETLCSFGITSGLVGIDGEMRALGLRPDGEAWTIAVEESDRERRAPYSILALQDAAVATSGDYRHWIDVGNRRLSHTMDPRRGAPLLSPPASVTVVARTCAEADGWATALMVLGREAGSKLARRLRLDALFLLREGKDLRPKPVGPLFGGGL